MRHGFALLLLTFTLPTQADTVFLCKSYSGERFWSSSHCGSQKAVIERMVTVPNDLPWDEQVKRAERVRQQGEALTAAPPPAPPAPPQPRHDPKAECKRLAERVDHLDSMARQPQSGATQEWITREKKKTRDRQWALRC